MEKSSAFYAGARTSIEKQALFFKPRPRVPLKMSFKGHSKALGLGTKVDPRGVATTRAMTPGGLQQRRVVTGVPGWTA